MVLVNRISCLGAVTPKWHPYQVSVIFASHCDHPAVLGNLLVAHPLNTDVGDFLEITEGLPLLKTTNING